MKILRSDVCAPSCAFVRQLKKPFKLLMFGALVSALSGQQAPTPLVPAPNNEPAKRVVTEARNALGDGEVLVLNPLVVNAEKDDGFMATNAGSATKLGLDMADMSAAYSVMTGDFVEALGITDVKEAILWSTNGSPVFDGQGADLFNIPSLANVRGVGLHTGHQRDFFLTGSISDTYNTERIEFGRGPNAVLFNVGANDALGGGISFVGKRARLDREDTSINVTTGSWD
jgi:outer membrane receptor protein involved in Fe transport